MPGKRKQPIARAMQNDTNGHSSLGVALLISNNYDGDDGSGLEKLPWTNGDCEELENLLKDNFGYEVYGHFKNRVTTDLLDHCNRLTDYRVTLTPECRTIFLYFCGHGQLGNDRQIKVLKLQDGKSIMLDDLISCFNTKAALACKSIVLVIDVYRTDNRNLAPTYHHLDFKFYRPNVHVVFATAVIPEDSSKRCRWSNCLVDVLRALPLQNNVQLTCCNIYRNADDEMNLRIEPAVILPGSFGVALLISNDYATDDNCLEELPYTHYDTRKLQIVLEKEFMYTVHRYSNVRADLSRHCNRIAMLEYPEQCRIIFFYFSGHGAIKDDKQVLYLQGGEAVVLDDLIECFNTPSLVHKTKLIFIDACRTEDGDIAPSYHSLDHKRIDQPNTLVVVATSAGYQAYQEGYLGSCWPKCLIAVLKLSTDQQNIYDILTQTQELMNEYNKPLDKISPGAFGVALLISNDYATDDNCLEELPYTHYDTRKLRIVLENKFMYTVHRYSNVRADLSRHCNRIAMLDYPEQCRIIFFYFSGHGAIKDDKQVLYLQGGKTIMLNDLIECFNTPALVHKTKLFFIDACRNKSERDNTSHNLVNNPIQNNVLIAFSTSGGFEAYQDISKGSRWTNCLIEALLHISIDESSVHRILDLTKMLMNKRNQSSGVPIQTDEYQGNITDNVRFAEPLGMLYVGMK